MHTRLCTDLASCYNVLCDHGFISLYFALQTEELPIQGEVYHLIYLKNLLMIPFPALNISV